MTEYIKIAIGVKQAEVLAFLESQTDVTYKFVQRRNYLEVMYEVTDVDGTHGDLLKHTKKLIRSLPYGPVLFLRVLYAGQRWDGDHH